MVEREKMRDSEEERGAYRTKVFQTDQPLYMKIICKSGIQIKTYKKSVTRILPLQSCANIMLQKSYCFLLYN